MELKSVTIALPERSNLILGQIHFIKTDVKARQNLLRQIGYQL